MIGIDFANRSASIISTSRISFQALCPIPRPLNPRQLQQFDPVIGNSANRSVNIITISWICFPAICPFPLR